VRELSHGGVHYPARSVVRMTVLQRGKKAQGDIDESHEAKSWKSKAGTGVKAQRTVVKERATS